MNVCRRSYLLRRYTLASELQAIYCESLCPVQPTASSGTLKPALPGPQLLTELCGVYWRKHQKLQSPANKGLKLLRLQFRGQSRLVVQECAHFCGREARQQRCHRVRHHHGHHDWHHAGSRDPCDRHKRCTKLRLKAWMVVAGLWGRRTRHEGTCAVAVMAFASSSGVIHHFKSFPAHTTTTWKTVRLGASTQNCTGGSRVGETRPAHGVDLQLLLPHFGGSGGTTIVILGDWQRCTLPKGAGLDQALCHCFGHGVWPLCSMVLFKQKGLEIARRDLKACGSRSPGLMFLKWPAWGRTNTGNLSGVPVFMKCLEKVLK